MTPDDLRAPFDAVTPFTVGLEEELMLLDSQTLDLAPRGREALEVMAGDPRFKLELPAAQLEIVTPPARTVPEAVGVLAGARSDLAGALEGRLRPACAGAHPFAAPVGDLNAGPRYDHIAAGYGSIARRQLVFGLHVHVAIGDADRALAVHDALRSYLPELAALAAGAPFHDGFDTGLASVRPTISAMLPRQGIPPALGTWAQFAETLRWGAAGGSGAQPRQWWWELRLHPTYGTVELRVPDAQATVSDTGAVAAVAHALVARLSARSEAGETLPVADGWRIAENRWSACRHGVRGTMADLATGECEPTAERIGRLLAELEPFAGRLGCVAELARARTLLDDGGAARRHRTVAERDGVQGLVRRLAGDYLEGT